MNKHTSKASGLILILLTAGLLSSNAFAQSSGEKSREIVLTPYLWGTAISGTSTAQRKAFQQMLTDAQQPSCPFRYIVVYDQPVTIKLSMLLSRPGFPFAWNDDYPNRVGLMPRDGGPEDIVWIDVTPGYVFHPMNAYDDADGNVVVDVCRYERMFDKDIYGPFGDSRPSGGPPCERGSPNQDGSQTNSRGPGRRRDGATHREVGTPSLGPR